jgi:hypothetical protein
MAAPIGNDHRCGMAQFSRWVPAVLRDFDGEPPHPASADRTENALTVDAALHRLAGTPLIR